MKHIMTLDNKYPAQVPFDERYGYANGPEIGLFQGNGDLFTSFWNKAHELTWSTAKTDVWDRRYFGDSKKLITLEEIKHIAFHGDPGPINATGGLPGSASIVNKAYDFPCPKPVGQIILRCPDMKDADSYEAELNMDEALLRVRAGRNNARLNVQSFVSAERSLIVIHAAISGAQTPLCFELYRHRDTTVPGITVARTFNGRYPVEYDYEQDADNGPLDPPEVGHDGPFTWIRQSFHAEPTFPRGFEYFIMAYVPDEQYRVHMFENIMHAGAKVPLKPPPREMWASMHGAHKERRSAIHLVNSAPGVLASYEIPARPDLSITAYISVKTTRDAKDPFSAAKEELQSAASAGYARLLDEHKAWMKTYWQRSSVRTQSPEFDRMWYHDVYKLGWSNRSGKVPLYNATGPLFTDQSPWHGDYHFNEIWLYPNMISNHAQEILPWLEMIEEMLPMAQANACDVYNCHGCCYTLIGYPIKSKRVIYSHQTWELGIEMTAMVLKPFWQYSKYTGDAGYLHKHAYPMMREGARFYTDYVTKEADGYYHIMPTVSQENWGLTKDFEKNRDSVGALSQVRYHLLACVEAAETLGLDPEEKKHWREIAENIAPYPTYMTDKGLIFVDVRDNKPSRDLNTSADLSMVFWGDQIHLDSDPQQVEIARRTYKMMYLKNGQYDHDRNTRLHYSRAIERRLGLKRAINYFDVEDLLMSFTGRMYIFIGVPENENAEFEHLLAWGGFEVSAEKKKNKIAFFQVKSLAGNCCRFRNPWHPDAPVVRTSSDEKIVPLDIDSDSVSFPTTMGETYAISES